MSEPSFERVRAVFLAARDLDAAGREDVLTRECATDAVLRDEVESLLSHHDAGRARATHAIVGPALEALLASGTAAERPLPRVFGQFELQEELGRERAGELVEQTMASIATRLVEQGVRKLVVAGGETAGAVVNALDVRGLRIGPQIDPGVPWTHTIGEPALALALKSGNFGAPDFFLKALDQLE